MPVKFVGEIFKPPAAFVTIDQLTQFPLAKNDDGPDALEMAMQAVKKKGGLYSISEF